MGCEDAVITDPLIENHIDKCLTFERNMRQPYNGNLCLFRALALHLHGTDKLKQETSIVFNFFLFNYEEGDPLKSQGVHLNDIPKNDALLQL